HYCATTVPYTPLFRSQSGLRRFASPIDRQVHRQHGTGLLSLVTCHLPLATVLMSGFVLITGASSGIGEAFARAFAARREDLILRSEEQTSELQSLSLL